MVSRHRDWSIARIHRRPPILARASLATTLSSRRHFFLFPFTHQTFPPRLSRLFNTIAFLLGKKQIPCQISAPSRITFKPTPRKRPLADSFPIAEKDSAQILSYLSDTSLRLSSLASQLLLTLLSHRRPGALSLPFIRLLQVGGTSLHPVLLSPSPSCRP